MDINKFIDEISSRSELTYDDLKTRELINMLDNCRKNKCTDDKLNSFNYIHFLKANKEIFNKYENYPIIADMIKEILVLNNLEAITPEFFYDEDDDIY